MAHRRIVELMRVQPEVRDIGWLQESLASAVQLELATIPTYLTAYWSVKSGEVQQLILEVVLQEMYHMGLAANLLTGIGGTPEITADAPVYPGPLPGGVRPELTVYIEGLSLDWLLFGEGGDGPVYRGQTRTRAELTADLSSHITRELARRK